MYGENTRVIREQLSLLLRQHRIQHRIGGPGIPTLPVTSTPAERRVVGLQIGRYRHAVLVWSLQAIRAISPRPTRAVSSRRHLDPTTVLLDRLVEAAHVSGPRPTIEELHTIQRYPLLQAWQTAARAASLGEHDFGSDIAYAELAPNQRRTILEDSATIIRALIVLDRRYANIPGWRPLPHPGGLGHAVHDCITLVNGDGIDLSVDLRGRRPRPSYIMGPPPLGICGVLQAQHNLLVSLRSIPDARTLRRVVESQLLLSRAVTDLTEPELSLHQTAKRRGVTYCQLQRLMRDLGDITDYRGRAAADAHAVATAAGRLTRSGLLDPDRVAQVGRSFQCVDDRISRIIDLGARRRLYLQRLPLPHLEPDRAGLIKSRAVEYVPMTGDTDAELVLAARLLQRDRPHHQALADSRHSRIQLESALGPPHEGISETSPGL